MNDNVLVLVSAALVSHLLMQQQPIPRLRLHVYGLACSLSIALGVMGGQWLEQLIVVPWQLQDLRLFLLLPWLALLARGVPQVLAKVRPQWPTVSLTVPFTGTIVALGLALQVIGDQQGGLTAVKWGVLSGFGFWLALGLFDDLQQRSDHPDVPRALRGLPIALLGAGVMAMAFAGLNGLFAP
ncbi:electron transporter RnfA [Pseudomonas sp. NC26]|uniref:Electron transporter RnfA n=1 Tax=Pseudomonas putida TaxID=303 RepID=A0A7W2L3B3_PSEPU|nr:MULTISPECIES: Rnf-Nqr domain containing protein [Pseudomonas]MBA6117709.1 electron transporter RnfA [Pseudomonas putida]MCZ9636262.1 electron transporter RnfA [Pseudomonas putida]MEC4877706.1 electron transporter RnfA [Pseudomonas sp. NC26]QNL89496.1 Electron transport complex protein RnfA [Pseudomonas putida]